MPKKFSKNKNKHAKKRRGGSSHLAELPVTSVVYRGPTHGSTLVPRLHTFPLVTSGSVVSTSSSNNFSVPIVFQASDISSTSGWSAISTNFQEVRVLSIEVKYVPKFMGYIPVSTSTTSVGVAPGSLLTPLVMCPFHEDATLLGSFSHGIAHEGARITPLNRGMVMSNKMRDVDEADFSKTASLSVTPFGVKFYFAGVSNGSTDAINWGTYIATYMCQFRSFVDNNTQLSLSAINSLAIPQNNSTSSCKTVSLPLDVKSQHIQAAGDVKVDSLTKEGKEDLEEQYFLVRKAQSQTSTALVNLSERPVKSQTGQPTLSCFKGGS